MTANEERTATLFMGFIISVIMCFVVIGSL